MLLFFLEKGCPTAAQGVLFLSLITWILISCCNFTSNLLFFVLSGKKRCSNGQQIWLIDRSSNFFYLSPQVKYKEWLNCCPRDFNFNHNLPEFWYPDAIFPLFLCSYVFSAGKRHKRSTDLPCWPVEQIFGLLTSLKDGYEVELLPRVLCFLSQLTWILISCCNRVCIRVSEPVRFGRAQKSISKHAFIEIYISWFDP